MSARNEILDRIRANQRSGQRKPDDASAISDRIAAHGRGPRPRFADDSASLLNRFIERSAALSTSIAMLEHTEQAPRAIAEYLAQSGIDPVTVVWPGLRTLDWAGSGVRAETRNAHGSDKVGITGAFCAVAETGTLLLCSSADSPGAVSLLPETHIAILDASRIVPTMEDAFAWVRAELGEPPRALNFISGPSRTADIEQTIVLGAHGPYRVHILIIKDKK